MEIKRVFFYKLSGDGLTQSDYIHLVDYKYGHPDEEVNVCFANPLEDTYFAHLLANAGIALLPLDSKEPYQHECYVLSKEKIPDDKVLEYPFFNMPEYVSRGITSETSVLDLGCGNKAIINQFPEGKITTVDVFSKFKPDILWDLNNVPLPFPDNSFDVILLLDVIEHLSKENGVKLLTEAQRICKTRLFVFTPLWWTENKENVDNPKSEYFGNKYDLHKSLWSVGDFKDFKQVHNRITEKYFFGYWEKT